ncbi:MAG TPA: type VI secretion system membrane subunit TssM [Nevskiaceae bacterium]
MLYRLRDLLHHPRLQALAAAVGAAGATLLGVKVAGRIPLWMLIAVLALLLAACVPWLLHRRRTHKAARAMAPALTGTDSLSSRPHRAPDSDAELLRRRMHAAVRSIKRSRLGQLRGRDALYELPWYMVIGSPAAGKSSAIVQSGLRFPFADERGPVVQGIGGTRNCDWYFTTEGILLDTAGRYAVRDDNRREWLSFLDLLRRYRPRAPINGIIIAASVAELAAKRPEFAIELATKLRQRVQELTERLEVIAPVYVVFTKADLIAGFGDFSGSLDEAGRNRVWGATLPFNADARADAAAEVDRHFDELVEGLREAALAQMALTPDAPAAPGLLTLPLEFAGLKPILKTFIATLFEDNPYQYRPVFRGFYFTSALQETASVHRASERIARRFQLGPATVETSALTVARSHFLTELFRKVIFADRDMVRRYSSPRRTRARRGLLAVTAVALAMVLGGWAWSYGTNRQLIANAQADLAHAVAVQRQRADLSSRLEALLILQDRLQQLEAWRHRRPLALGFGLYQGDQLERKLRLEYFAGMRTVMLAPASEHLEHYLAQLADHRDELRAATANATLRASTGAAQARYQPPSPSDPQEAYNALKAYLMLGQPERVDAVLLSGQLTRFWRDWLETHRGAMTREQLIATAQRLVTFYVTQYREPGWPTIDGKVTLVEDTRGVLREVMRGTSAIERVYAQIITRAGARYPSITLTSLLKDVPGSAALVGSQPVASPYTRAAWRGYVKPAIDSAASRELSTSDWVLQSVTATDLTLTGSPEHVKKELRALYDREYIRQWKAFVQGVDVPSVDDFDAAVRLMNALGDPRNSPLAALLQRVHDETSWGAPAFARPSTPSAGGLSGWFARVILRRPVPARPAQQNSDQEYADREGSAPTSDTIASAFAAVTRAVASHDGRPSPLAGYVEILGKLRARLAAIGNQDTAGPGARALIAATLGEGRSELAAGLQWVDEQMLGGVEASEREALRPLLLKPLTKTFRALIAPAEADVNAIWRAQVHLPFEQNLAGKYPFDRGGRVQAAATEIATIFGPDGAIAKFAGDTLAPLVRRRGDTLTPRQWAGMGINLSATFMADYARWTAPLDQTTAAAGTQTVFEIQPLPAGGGISGYSININGQQLQYLNTPPVWKSFVWSGEETAPIAEIQATTADGRSLSIANHTGPGALSQLFRAASGGLDKQTGIYSLSWSREGVAVQVRLRIVSSPQATASGTPKRGLTGTRLPASVVGGTGGAAVSLAHPEGDDT